MLNTHTLLHSHSHRVLSNKHYNPSNHSITSMPRFHLTPTFNTNNLPLDPRVHLMLQPTTLDVLLHLILAVDPAHLLRRPHLISRLRHLIHSRHLHPLYRVQPHMVYNWSQSRKHHKPHQPAVQQSQLLSNPLRLSMPPIKLC